MTKRGLVVTPILEPEYTGVTTMLRHLVRSLTSHGWNIHVVAPAYPGMVAQYQDADDKDTSRIWRVRSRSVFRYPTGRHFPYLWSVPEEIFAEARPDVVFVFEPMRCRYATISHFIPRRYRSLPRIGFVCTDYERTARHHPQGILLTVRKWRTPILDWLIRDLASYDCLIAPSVLQQKRLANDGGLRNVVALPFYGIDPDIFEVRDKRQIRDKFTVTCLGRISREKQIELVVQSCRELQDKGIQVELLLIGGCVEATPPLYLQHRWVTETGFVPPARIPTLLHETHCLVVSNPGETLGLGLLEAMATGLPVVCPENLSAELELKNRQSALLLQVNTSEEVDSGEIARQLEWIYMNYDDAKAIGKRASAIAHANTWTLNMEKIGRWLDDWLTSRGG